MPSQSGEVSVHVLSVLSNAVDLTSAKSILDETYSVSLANGTGADQASQVVSDDRSLATGTNEDLDLAGGLSNAFGAAVTFTKAKAIVIYASKANTGNLTVTRPAANGVPLFLAASDGFTLAPGGLFVLCDPSSAGIAITAGTGDLINVANASGATQAYKIIVIGVG